MINAKINSAFNSWLEYIEVIKRTEALMKKVGNRIRLAGVSKSINRWKEYSGKRKWLRRFCTRMIGGTRVKMLAAGLDKWKQGLHNSELEQIELELQSAYSELEGKDEGE